MPGIYGSVNFVIGKPTSPKPVESAPCVVCDKDAYRQTFSVATGWAWRHQGCDPRRTHIDRPRNRAGHTQAYVPSNYERSTAFDPAIGRAITESRRG